MSHDRRVHSQTLGDAPPTRQTPCWAAIAGPPVWHPRPVAWRSPLAALMLTLALAGCGGGGSLAPTMQAVNAPRGAAPEAASRAAEAAPDTASPAKAAAPGQPSPSKPQLIKTATIALKVDSLDGAIASLKGLVDRQGGDLLSLDERRSEELRQASGELRVPQDKLEATLTELSRLGRLQGRSLQSEDATNQIVDAAARLRNLRRTEESLVNLLSRAGSIRDVLAVTQQLSQVREQIEQIDAQLSNLQNRVAYSRIRLTIEQSVAGTNTDNPLLAQLGETWGSATQSAGGLAVGLLKLGLWLLAYTPYWLLIGLAVWGGRRAWRSRRASR